MERTTLDKKICWASPSRYIQGFDLIEELPKYCERYGKKALIISTSSIFSKKGRQIRMIFERSNFEVYVEICEGKSNEYKIQTISKKYNCDFVVGIGGGNCIDIAKAVADFCVLPVIIIPSVISTDAAVTSRSVIYNEDCTSYAKKYDKNPELILVDESIIMESPVKFFIAGIGDALTTYFEARANILNGRNNLIKGGYLPSLTGISISKACLDILLDKGKKAVIDMEKKIYSLEVQEVIEAVILMSGLGSENCGCGLAHSIGEGLSVIQNCDSLHGEQVAFGLICQLIAEKNDRKEIDKIIDFNYSIGLPICLADMQLDSSSEVCETIASLAISRSCWQETLLPPIDDEEAVIKIILEADRTGKLYKSCVE